MAGTVPIARSPVRFAAVARPRSVSPQSGQIEIQGEIITNDIVNLIIPRLSETQQQILFLLLKGCGVRETGREIGITHPAVIKHRKKIARIAREFLQDSEGVGATRSISSPTVSTGVAGGNSDNGTHSA